MPRTVVMTSAAGVLQTGVTAGATSWELAAGHNFPADGFPFTAYAGDPLRGDLEAVTVTARAANTLTVTRGSPAYAHPANRRVWYPVTITYPEHGGTLGLGGAAAAGGAAGSATVDFGAYPGTDMATVAVTGQVDIVGGSIVQAFIRPVATADHSADEHMVWPFRVFAGNVIAGTGFTIYVLNDLRQTEPDRGFSRAFGGGALLRPHGLWSVGWMWR